MNAFHSLLAYEGFTDLDREFGRFCSRLVDNKDAGLMGLWAALVSQARASGDSCLRLAQWADKILTLPTTTEQDSPQQFRLPNLQQSLDFLNKQAIVGNGTPPTPFVLREDRLYLFRFWVAETQIATYLQTNTQEPFEPSPNAELATSFQELFGPFGPEPDWQAVAAFAATRHQFTLITGGPGTGKTTTVIRLLAILLQQQPELKIGVAAPTGKAVARLSASLSTQLHSLPEAIAEKIPSQVFTLHRMLGYSPKKDAFHHNATNPLPYDLVVIDEASMVDLLLMSSLIAALSDGCRLILLGDHQQLASVDAGNILADLCAIAELDKPHNKAFTQAYDTLTGQNLLSSNPPVSKIRDSVVKLEKSRRFDDTSGLGALAFFIRSGLANKAIELLGSDKETTVQLQPLPRSETGLVDKLKPHLNAYFKAQTPQQAFECFNQLQLLTALREGNWGVKGLNQTIEQHLLQQGHRFLGEHYHLRPIIVTKNDYETQLFNGDIGLCWLKNGQKLAYFPDQSDLLRTTSLLKLPPVESAWALTVHKSQGSEFQDVLFVLPPNDHPLCLRELLYTGITRARHSVMLWGSEHQVSEAIDNVTQRASGLSSLFKNHN